MVIIKKYHLSYAQKLLTLQYVLRVEHYTYTERKEVTAFEGWFRKKRKTEVIKI